jgi:integrin alpha 1
VAVVKVTMNFEPNKVNIQKKNCRVEGKETVCINATMCFDVKLKSKEDSIYEAGKHNNYNNYWEEDSAFAPA